MTEDAKFTMDAQQAPREQNRAEDIPSDGKNISVTLYTIDNAIIKYLSERIRPVVTQNGTQVPVPVVYGDSERWKSAQRDGALRDSLGKIQLPIIMVRRTGMSKSGNSPVNKYYDRSFKTGWNRRNPYDQFAVLNGITPSTEYYHINGTPDYYKVSYRCIIWTEFMEQMNQVVENVAFESDEFWGEPNGYKFRAKIDRFDTITQLPSSADRLVRTQFDMTVSAYLLPESQLDTNHNRKMITGRRYGAKKIVTFVEADTE